MLRLGEGEPQLGPQVIIPVSLGRINLNIGGCSVVAPPVHSSSRAPMAKYEASTNRVLAEFTEAVAKIGILSYTPLNAARRSQTYADFVKVGYWWDQGAIFAPDIV